MADAVNQDVADLRSEQLWKPVARARQLWAARRALVTDLELPPEEQRAVVKAVRRSAVFQAGTLNVDATARTSVFSGLLALVLAIVFTVLARPSGVADVASTLAGVLVGVLLCLLPIGVLLMGMDRLTVRWPQFRSGATTSLWSVMVLGATLAAVLAAGRPAGFLIGLAWSPATLVLATSAGEVRLTCARLWRRSLYKVKGLPAAMAAEQLLMAVGTLSRERRSWRTVTGGNALAGDLLRRARLVEQAFGSLARWRGWGLEAREARAEIRDIWPRVQNAVLAYRRGVLNATSQREYDELVDRAKRHLVAVANQQWDELPARAQGHVGHAAVAVFVSVVQGTALGLAVNAASEHLPAFMDKPVVSWAAVAAFTVAVALLQLRWR